MFNTLSVKYNSGSRNSLKVPLREMQYNESLSRSFEHHPRVSKTRANKTTKSGKENEDPHIAIFSTTSSSSDQDDDDDEEEEEDEIFKTEPAH